MSKGTIKKVAGPLVIASGMRDANMFDVVRVSDERLIGEIIEIHGDEASIQVYEETSGLGPGEPVESMDVPLSVELGPGLLTSIHDGIQRPLDDIMKETGSNNLKRGVEVPSLKRDKKWQFVPTVKAGDSVEAGDIIGTVQETLILPLYSRKLCTELYPNLYRDETAVRLLDQINYNFSGAEKNSRSLMQRFGALEVAMRQNDLAFEVRAYLKTHPCAAVVNLGCGLDNTGRACDNGSCKIYNLDFPDVIALRQQLLPAGEREQNIPCDLKDPAWFGRIDASGGAVFFASGVFYYFPTQQVRELVRGMADAFPGGVLVFDAANRTAVKMIAKTWLKTAKIKDVRAYFAVSDAEHELAPWGKDMQISSRGYMLGYNDLKDPSVSGFFRFLARIGDNGMKMQIVKIGFGGRQ